jgi:hypothetical protein
VGKLIVRESILSIVRVSTTIYDPSVIKRDPFGPGTEDRINWGEYQLADKALPDNESALRIHIKTIHNEKIIRSSFDFSYQPYDEPKLILLRKEYGLDNVAASAKNEFDRMVLLRNWARSRFKRSDYQPRMTSFDSLAVLRANIHNPSNKPWQPGSQLRPCHFFPMFYSQVLISMGYQPRLVRISNLDEKGYDGHGIAEVWSNQFKKWIAMDVDQNLHYEKDGIPLSALEVHYERYAGKPSLVKIIRGVQTSGDAGIVKQRSLEEMIAYHSYVQIVDMRNDWMTNPYFKGHPKRSDHSSLFWVDGRMPPVFNLKPKTSAKSDFYWTLNQTELWAKVGPSDNRVISMAFKTYTPNFKHYEIIIDGLQKTITTDPLYMWRLHEGDNKFQIRSVNKFGIGGIPSLVDITVD